MAQQQRQQQSIIDNRQMPQWEITGNMSTGCRGKSNKLNYLTRLK